MAVEAAWPRPTHDRRRQGRRVSHQAVSRVLNDYPGIRREARERVLDAIARLGYRRNAAARLLASGRPGRPDRGEGEGREEDAKKFEDERQKLEEERKKQQEESGDEGGGNGDSSENGPDDGSGRKKTANGRL